MRVLVAYSMSSTFVQTTLDYLLALKRHLNADVEFVHVTQGALMDFDFSSYDVVFHNYCSRLCFPGHVSDNYLEAMRRFRGLKILAVQDEYDETDTLKAAITNLEFHIVLTCVPPDGLEYVYPKRDFPGVRFERVLTGYVSEGFAAEHAAGPPLSQRHVVVGYRGRDIGGRYGRLGYEKYIIGVRMAEICAARGVPHDIAVDEHSRIYGPAWFDFVGGCRAMLGSESGSNVFDFDGSIARRYRELAEAQGGQVSYEAFAPFVAAHENAIDMGQISPRVFECAVMRTPMVLFRGRYSDAIAPDEHYIALEKDFSNVDAVLDRLQDLDALERMTARAHAHLVASGTFGYAAFVARLRAIIDEELARRPRPATGAIRVAPSDRWLLSVRGQRPTPVPGDKRQYEREQGRYYVGIYGAEIDRLDAVVAAHAGTLTKEAARLDAAYRSYGALLTESEAPLPVSLPQTQFREALDLANLHLAAYERDRARLETDAHSGASAADNAWSDLSARMQARIAEINSDLAAVNLAYDRFVAQANALIRLGAARRTRAAMAQTRQVLARERSRLEGLFTAALARFDTGSGASMERAPLDFAVYDAVVLGADGAPLRALEREIVGLIATPDPDVDWRAVSARVEAMVAACDEEAFALERTWNSAAREARVRLRMLGSEARRAAGWRGAPAHLQAEMEQVFWAARQRALALARRGGPLVEKSGRRAVESLRTAWRRLRS